MRKNKKLGGGGNPSTYNNSLDLVRILAAFQVFFGHMAGHLELPIPIDKRLFRVSHFLNGVPIFFIISGFLIWFSIARSENYGQYLNKRFWRIYPELWVAVIVEITVVAILYHGWVIKQLLLFSFCQGTVFQFWTPDSLRGYGVGTPNGTLWTIGVMIQFYVVVWLFYKLMQHRKITTWIVGFFVAFAMSWLGEYVTHNVVNREIIEKLYGQTFIKYFWLFYIGMFIAEFKNMLLPLLQKYWGVFLIMAFFFFWTGLDLFSGYHLLWSFFLGAGLIGFAYRFPMLSIKPDISYGLFLYHMTVVNVFVNFGWIENWVYAIPVILISLTLAYLSTITIGRLSYSKK